MISWLLNKLWRPNPLPPKGIFLGATTRGGKPIVLADSVLRSHIALSGRDGQGRSGLLQQMLVQQTVEGRGWVHIDPSGDEGWRDHIAAVAREAGRLDDFYVLDLVDPANSNTYDVLRAGTAEARAQRVLTLLPAVDNAGAEHVYKQVGDVLTLLFDAITATGKSAGLLEVAELLMGLGTPATREQLLSGIPEGHPAGTALRAALDALVLETGESPVRTSFGGGVAGRLALLANLKCSAVFNHAQPELDFEDVLAGGKMCLIRLSPLAADGNMGLVARMVLQDLCSAMTARAVLPRVNRTPFLVALDSFPEYGLSDAVNAAMNGSTWAQARGLNISLVPVVDSGNWDRVQAEHGTETLTGNTLTKVYFQQDDSELLAKQHADLAAGVLPALQPGHFLMRQGTSVVEGQIPYTPTGASPEFKKQPMPGLAALPRLTLTPAQTT